MLQNLAELWDLQALTPISNTPYTQILSALHNTRQVILKISDDARKEAQILELYHGYGAVEIIEFNDNAILLERALPGNALKSYFPDRDEESVKIACDVMKKLYKAPIPSNVKLPHLKDRLKALDNTTVPHIEKARNLRDKLLDTTISDVLLHGDLHHDNILRNGEDWVIIDPKGLIGDATYDVACFIRNPIPELLSQPNVSEIIQKRIKLFAQELDIDAKHIAEWCFVDAVMSHVWAAEDGIDPDYFGKIVEVMHSVVGL